MPFLIQTAVLLGLGISELLFFVVQRYSLRGIVFAGVDRQDGPMKFGHFDDDRQEYVIERPDTPLPWINYLGTQDLTRQGGLPLYLQVTGMPLLCRLSI